MAKKKKSSSTKNRQTTEVSPKQSTATTAYTWLAAVGGGLLVVSFLFIPWLSVVASPKNGITLIGGAFSNGEPWIGTVLVLFTLVGAAAAALPFLPPRQKLRDWANTGLAIGGGINVLALTILTSSTRNFLAFGAGRQRVSDTVFLLFLSLGMILAGTVGNLLHKDLREVENAKQELTWYAAFLLVLVAILYFNYSVIPHSIIEPPDFVRQRMGY